MPIYVYECGCGHSFEDLQSMPGKQKMTCPKCGRQAGKVMSPCSFKFKGPGFYETDYKQKEKSKTEKKEDDK